MKTLKKIFPKALCLILAVIILFYAIPGNIYADTIDALTFESSSEEATASVSDSGTAYTYEGQAYEVEALREPSVKHFHLKDGTYVAAQYEYPVHEVDESGALVDIDNELISSGNVFQNKNSRIKFAKKTTGNGTLFTLHDGSTKISFSLNGAAKGVAGSVTNGSDAEEETELQKMMNLEKLSASIIYREVLPGVDLEYIASSRNIKENIIVKERSDSYSYSFELALNGLSAALSSGGDIVIKNSKTNATQYVIPSPVVFDANGEYAADEHSSYVLADNGNGKYTLYVTVSSEWMNYEERAFPVTVDPTISKSCSLADVLYISSDQPNTSFEDYSTLYVGDSYSSYLRIDPLPRIPAGSYITDASLTLYVSSESNSYVGVHQVLSDWDHELTYNRMMYDLCEGTPSTQMLDCVHVGTEGFVTFNVTKTVRAWYDGEAENYGISFIAMNENDERCAFDSTRVIDSHIPRFIMSYVNMNGVEDYWSYSSHSAGSGGIGSINLANGGLTLAVPTLSTTDSLFPYAPTLVYNSSLAGKEYAYPNVHTPFDTSYTGYGFKLNINEYIVEKSYIGENNETKTYYEYDDADGTKHAFYESATEGVFLDEDGMLKVLREEDNGMLTITDDSKHIRTFEPMFSDSTPYVNAWHLIKITDEKGNAIEFDFDLEMRPTDVSLVTALEDCIEFLDLYYYTSGKLKMIYNNASQDAVVFRYSSTYNGDIVTTEETNYLRRIDFACGVAPSDFEAFVNSVNNIPAGITLKTSAIYTYDENGRITSIVDSVADQEICYDYTDLGKVKSVKHVGVANLRYNYAFGITEVLSRSAGTSEYILTTHVFDKRGRSVSIYSKERNGGEIYGATVGEYETQENIKNNLKEQTVIGGSAVNYLLNGNFETEGTGTPFKYWTSTGLVSRANDFVGDEGMWCLSLELDPSQSSSISQSVFVDSGNYTISMQYVTQNADNVSGRVTVTSIAGSGFSHSEKISLNKTLATGIEALFSTSFTVPRYINGGDKLKITIEFSANEDLDVSPRIDIDNVMLENGIGPSGYSLVGYGSFEESVLDSQANATALDTYWKDETAAAPTTQDDSDFGNCVKITADIESRKYVKQRIYTLSDEELYLYDYNGTDFISNANNEYVVSGFAAAPTAVPSPNSVFGIKIVVTYYQGEGGIDIIRSFTFDFQPLCEGWQFTAGKFSTEYTPSADSIESRYDYSCVKSIDLYCEFSYQPQGYALFDNISVVNISNKDNVKYQYYENGLLAVKENLFYREYYEYDDNRNLIRVANNRGELTDYTYANNKVETVVDYDFRYGSGYDYPFYSEEPDSLISKIPRTKTTYSYDVFGLLVMTETCLVNRDLSPISGAEKVRSRNTYYTNLSTDAKIFGALKSEELTSGEKILYYYDTSNGRLLAKINENSESGICYSYNAKGELINVMPASVTESGYAAVTNGESITYTYNSRALLSTITTESTGYNFSYDTIGNVSSVAIGSNEIVGYEYDSNGNLIKIIYANGISEEYVYNSVELLKEIWYNDSESSVRQKAYEYEYTASGQLYKFIDNINGKTTIYKYDTSERLTDIIEYGNDDSYHDISTDIYYNTKGELSGVYYNLNYLNGSSVDVGTWSYQYRYTTDGLREETQISALAISGSERFRYDDYDRLAVKTLILGSLRNVTAYTYSSVDGVTSSRIATYSSAINNTTLTYTFTYDGNGNITKIVYSTGKEIRYVYDDLGQLLREDNEVLGETYVYAYDNAGNITSKKRYTLTAANATPGTQRDSNVYTYSTGAWGDQLTGFNGTAITYDALGNPLSYYSDAGSYTFSWTGRTLTGMTSYGTTASFTYNDEGIRTSKTVNGVTTTYYLSGSQILAEETSGNLTLYIYDSEGLPIGMQYHGAAYAEDAWDVYWFEKNIFGDIVSVYDNSGNLLLVYNYDAYGEWSINSHNDGIDTPAGKNPFRYRGYYYDSDLDMYYLNARYYDPYTGRFISPDSLGYLGANGDLNSFNLYAYCGNNPVMGYDPLGTFDWSFLKTFGENCIKAAAIAVGVAAAVVVMGAAIGGTIASGGAGAIAIPAAVAIAANALAASAATVVVVGATAIAVAEVGISVSYLVGENGTEIKSKSVWYGEGKERLDIENQDPGKRDGQIHFHDAKNKKHKFDFSTRKFSNPTRRLKELLTKEDFLNALEKALRFLGE